jgi:predicted 3-demethylubiquinone-9 3-methyltransferase (glyoxalase superfamily)
MNIFPRIRIGIDDMQTIPLNNIHNIRMKTPIIILIFAFLVQGCSDIKPEISENNKIERLQAQNDSLKSVIDKKKSDMEEGIIPFLTFQENNAEEAMNYYVQIFDNSEIIEIQRYGKDSPAKEGTIMKAIFELNGKKFICSDSYIQHDWTFSPAISMFVECNTENELDALFKKLSKNGKVYMELNNYGFSQKFGWVEDKFGVSWQLNLE